MSDPCLTLAELDRLAAPGADAGPRAHAHLGTCPACREALARARADDRLFEELRSVATATGPATATDDGAPAWPRDGIDGYRMVTLLHRGGQGLVYLAVQEDSGERFAIKIERSDGVVAQHLRFEREILVAGSLDHPDIVPVTDSGRCGVRRWFAMPFVEGRQLDLWIRAERPELRTLLALFVRICRAVGYAHRRGVIHRDLKPGNVLVDEGGAPHLLDFGVAKDLDALDPRLTATGQFAGTPAYASPEQLDGVRGAVTTGTDVYSLGVMLHECLTGAMPYPVDGGIGTVATNVLSATPRKLRPAKGSFDWSLQAIVARCLEKAPANRYPAADDLAHDLQRYLDGEPVLGGTGPWWYLVRRGIRRNRRAIIAVGCLFLAAVAVVWTVLYFHFRAVGQRATAGQIQGVLNDILRAAGPQRMGGSATLIEILEEAADRIETNLHESPDVQAAVQFTIGETYLDLLMFEDAQRHLSAALARYRLLGERPPVLLARTLHLLGVAASYRNDRRGVEWLREALALRSAMYPADDLRVVLVRRDLARAVLDHPDHLDDEPARRTLEAVLAELQRRHGSDHPEVARTLLALGTWHLRRREQPAADALLRRAAAIFALPDNRNSPWAVTCLSHLASLALRSERPDRFAEARQLLDRSSALATRLFGEAQGTRMLRQFANFHYSRGEFEVSERFSRDAVAHELRFWGRRRPGDREHLQELAARVAAGGEGAHPALLEGFRLFREYRGRGAYELASWLNGLATLLRDLRRPEQADDLLRESLEFDCRVYGRDCPMRFTALQLLGESRIGRGEPGAALPYLLEARGIAERTDRMQRPEARRLLEQIAACRKTLGKGDR